MIKERKVRDSNIELLRIISMLMVLSVHIDGASLGLPEIASGKDQLTAVNFWKLSVETVSIIGVNCFTIISGYFGIRFKVKGVLSYVYQCVFYSVLITTVFWILPGQRISFEDWILSWLALSHTDLWYVPAYFILMIIAPFLNAGFDLLERRTATWLVGVLIFVNVWSGWLWGGRFNPTGYTVVQLVMVYCIGRWIRLYVPRGVIRGWRKRVFFVYLISLGLIFGGNFFMGPLKVFAYNSPMVLLSTVCFFGLFLGIELRSVVINWIARSSFAVYLIHKNPLVWVRAMRPGVLWLWGGSRGGPVGIQSGEFGVAGRDLRDCSGC